MPVPQAGRPPLACPWLRELAAGYLLGSWTVRRECRGGLWGSSFAQRSRRALRGIFVGFLTRPPQRLLPGVASPSCLVFAFVEPAGGRLWHRLVGQEGSLFRRSSELLKKYSSHRPRFEFHEEQAAAIRRHVPLAEFPSRQREKYARNFFTESLALLVRSGLPEELRRQRRL